MYFYDEELNPYVNDINNKPYYPMGYRPDELDKYANLIKNWNVFISPEGKVYKVSEYNSCSTGHDNFAVMHVGDVFNQNILEEYRKLRRVKPDLVVNLGPKDILINLYGYVDYEKDVKQFPDPKYNGRKVTSIQIEVMKKLASLNGEVLGNDFVNAARTESNFYQPPDNYFELTGKKK